MATIGSLIAVIGGNVDGLKGGMRVGERSV